MVPEWLQGSKKEPFGVTLGCVLVLFWYVFCVTFQCLCSRCGDFSSYFLLQIVTRCSYYILICCVFNVYTYSVDMVEVAPGRPQELLGYANIRSSFLLHLCLLVLSGQQL